MVSITVAAGLAVAALVAGVMIGRRRSGTAKVVWTEGPRRSRSDDGTETHDPETDDLLRRDQLIAAIKRHRTLTGVGLKEAKEAMEARRRALR